MNRAIVAICKGEEKYLREWVTFHRLQGFDKFFLYDNSDDDRQVEALLPAIDSGVVEMQEWPGHAAQLDAYRDAIEHRPGMYADWLAFLDIDEFLWSPLLKLDALLEDATARGVVQISARWFIFGDSGLQSRDTDGLVIHDFHRRMRQADPNPAHVKSLVRPGFVHSVWDPHRFGVDGTSFDAPTDELRVNHYWVKSREEAVAKFQRGRSDTGTHRAWSEYENTRELHNEWADRELTLRWGGRIRQMLKDGSWAS